MNELKMLLEKYPQELRLVSLVLIILLSWFCMLRLISIPLTRQHERIIHQERLLTLANLLPSNWQTTVNSLDTTDLIGQLSKNWQVMMKNQNLQFSQVNRQQLKLKINAYEEQSLLQWLWAMQGQYAFKIEQMQMHPSPGKVGFVDAEFVLQVI